MSSSQFHMCTWACKPMLMCGPTYNVYTLTKHAFMYVQKG